MSMELRLESEPDAEASELKMAAAYGIEGLKRCTETTEYDEWLDLFDVILEELNKPLQSGSGSFPVKQAVFPEEEQRQAVIEEIQEISETAQKIKKQDIESRKEMQQLDEQIEQAEEIYEHLEALASN
jgi:hypothetical protein